MNGPANVRLDEGAVNQRILAREAVGDYRRVEQASLKQIVSLKSPEAKRVFARYFHSLQLNTHFISDITASGLRPRTSRKSRRRSGRAWSA